MAARSVAVAGGGMAGMAAACCAAARGLRVYLFERNRSLGNKLLVTGLGQCNITHSGSVAELLAHYGKKSRFLKHALYAYPNTSLVKLVESRGVPLSENKDGKIFPASLKSLDIRNCLLSACKASGTEILYGIRVDTVIHESGQFRISSKAFSAAADALVIATGGCSYPQTGSDGDGYRIARLLGHSITEPRPALTPIEVDDFNLAELAGLSFTESTIRLERDGKRLCEHTGDLLITHTGLSGPVILDNSRDFMQGDVLKIAFLKDAELKAFENRVSHPERGEGKKLVKTVLSAFGLAKRLASKLLAISGIPEQTTCSALSREKRATLMGLTREFPIIVKSLCGFDVAFTTAGGVSTDEIHPQTMESRLVRNLFFAGEVIDYDADTGGYCLQAAFSTGALAGTTISKRFSDEIARENRL